MEAKQCYQNAISINPSHIKSLQHLVMFAVIFTIAALFIIQLSNTIDFNEYYLYFQGLIYHYLGSQRLAEKTLRDAAKIDPNSHQTW